MPGKRSSSKTIQYLGLVIATIAVIGYVVFGWRFGEPNGIAPYGIGAIVAIFAVGLTLYRWLSSSR